MISLSDLTKRYGHTTVVDGITLDIPLPGLTSIIGPNGAGKSTLLAIMARLLHADAGTATIDGRNVFTTPTRDIAKLLAVLRQDNQTAARVSVRDVVAFGRFPHSRGTLTPACHQAIDDAMALLSLEDLQDRFIDELSGGQRQRAFVAMVFAQQTPYILLDEPLNNLDMRHAVTLMRTIHHAAQADGRCVVLVVHDINIAAGFSDHLIALKDGRVHTSGATQDVMRAEVLSDVYDMPIEMELVRGRPTAVYY